ncbi:MAG: hypothetical protein NXI31_10705 [bacterium]|nr:hypothetical protein [bacterium]
MAETAGQSSPDPRSTPDSKVGLLGRSGWQSAAAPGGPWSRWELLLVIGITLLAAGVRFFGVEVWSMSAAEAMTWRHATVAATESWRLSDLLVRVFWESGLLPSHGEGWLRLPFLFVATLAVPLLALVGEVLVPRRVALLAAGLLAVHPWHVEVCQLATGHGAALTVAMFALATVAAVRRRHENDDAPDSEPATVVERAGLAGLLVLAGWIHPIGWLALLAVVASRQRELVMAENRRDRPRRYLAWTVVGVAVVVVTFFARAAGESGAPLALLANLQLQLAAIGLPVLLFAGLLPWLPPRAESVGTVVRQRTRRELATAALVVGIAPAVLGLFVVTPAREHALLVLPFLLLLAAGCAIELSEHLRAAVVRKVPVADGSRAGRAGSRLIVTLPALALVLDLLIGTFLYTTARRGSRPDWRGVRDIVVSHVHKRHLDVVVGAGHDSMIYYLRPNHWREVAIDPHPEVQVVPLPATPVGLAELVDLMAPRRAANEGPDEPPGQERGDSETDLFVVTLRDERAELRVDPDVRALLDTAFELFAVLPCAGTQRDETVFVHRWVGAR